ncbi:MAG: AMP-binding protein [bacterium]|nr:AMP-binding protein [bacterium]
MGGPAERYRRRGWWTGEALVDRFARHAAARPEVSAVVDGADRWSAGRLWDAAGAGAERIAEAAGDGRRPVLIHLPNSAEWMVSFLATLRSGHVPATIPITTPGAHLAHVVDLIDPAAVITCEDHHGTAPVRTVQEAMGRTAVSPALLTAGGSELAVRSAAGRAGRRAGVPAATSHLMFTSSTTGPPKAVSHSDDTLATLNRQFADRFGLDGTSPIFMPSPLGHSVGAIHGARLSLYLGVPLVLQDRWDAGEALRLVDEHEAVFTAAATPFLLDLLNARWAGPRPKLGSLRSFLCGGAHVPPALMQRCIREFPHTFVTPLWGMTEGGLTTCVDGAPAELVRSTVGVGLPDLELRVIDGGGHLRAEGEGELVMRGPGVFNGYYGQPELYRRSTTTGGFFRTGDLARIRPDRYVVITGRLKDLIVRGGVNISPVDTENTLAGHPDVDGVAVIGWPDDRLGERLCAVVRSTAPLDLATLLEFCERSGLPRRCWPERLEIVAEFPRTAAGKIRKQELREQLLARQPLSGGASGE